MRKGTRKILGLGAVMILAMPPVIFLWAGFSSGLDSASVFEALAEQYSASRQNLLVLSGLGMAPWALLAVVLLVIRRFSKDPSFLPFIAGAGLVPILAVLVWTHVDFWPLFFPGRTYPGFPHGLGFVIGPFVFAPIAMVVGLVIAWLTKMGSRHSLDGR